jgi:hypothetical protein
VHASWSQFSAPFAFVAIVEAFVTIVEVVVVVAVPYPDASVVNALQAALAAAGATRVFAEKASGAVTDRKALGRAIATLASGDTLLVTKLDRLARSTRDLLNTFAAIAEAGAGFRSLADAWAGTTTPHGRLMLTVLGGLAEFERHLILARTSEGRLRAKARGVRVRPQTCAHPAPTRRGATAPRGWRSLHGDSPELCGEPQHNQSACRGVAPSELADGS